MSISNYYNTRFYRYTLSSSIDSTGDVSESLTLSFNKPARLELLNGNEIISLDKKGIKASYKLFCTSCSLNEYDILSINSEMYDIKELNPVYDASEIHHFEIFLEKN